ncbi:MAG: amidohydrolase family protein [Acidobacteriaceae bacterium]|nr:amidohydrolase family protein [Acidobacteriaceae bacterium]
MNTRRQLFQAAASTVSLTAFGAAGPRAGSSMPLSAPVANDSPLPITSYEPKSMLRVPETHVPRPRYPVIDIHTHLSWSTHSENGIELAAERQFLASPEELLEVMDGKNIRAMVNLTGGYDDGLRASVQRFDRAHPNRFFSFTEPSYARFLEADYPRLQAHEIEQAHRDGARGLKILKTLGLCLRENITSGALVKVDDRRFDPMWDTCGQLGIPVAIHVSDPIAFFQPIDRFNERYEELHNHPDWSFYGRDFPSNAELLEARNRVITRHPKTQFLVLHVGNFAEDLGNVSECLDRFPNMTVDIAARIGELGRQPRTARKFFDKYQDRILFGTDATPHGDEFPQQLYCDRLYEIYYRFLETDDEYFDYAPSNIPPQGRWRIYGIGLADTVLKKVYSENAERLLKL